MFSFGIVKVTEHRAIKPDAVTREFFFKFADGSDGYLFADGEVRLTIVSEVK